MVKQSKEMQWYECVGEVDFPIDKIRFDADLQIRVDFDEDAIEQYRESMTDYEALRQFPRVKIMRYPNRHCIVIDGHHRVLAAKGKFDTIPAIVTEGHDTGAAILQAIEENRRNGIRLTRADIRRAIAILLKHCRNMSDRAIAEKVGCSHVTVAAVRASGQTDHKENDASSDSSQSAVRVGSDGRRVVVKPHTPISPAKWQALVLRGIRPSEKSLKAALNACSLEEFDEILTAWRDAYLTIRDEMKRLREEKKANTAITQ